MTSQPTSPADTYRARLQQLAQDRQTLARRDAVIAGARLVVFLTTAALAWVVFRGDDLGAIWLALPAGLFAVLLLVHDRTIRGRQRTDETIRFYEEGLGRIEDRWPVGDGSSRRFQDPEHPYSADLDIFGAGSLFQRLCTARTTMGQETLAAWLKAPALPPIIRGRQQAVDELRARLDLKEDLAVLGHEADAEIHPHALSSWASASATVAGGPAARLGLRAVRIVTAGLGSVATGTLIWWAFLGGRPWPFAVALLLGLGFARWLTPLTAPVLAAVHRRSGELTMLAVILARLERERFHAPALVALRAALDSAAEDGAAAVPPSRRIAQLARLVTALDVGRNQLMALVVAPLLWTTQAALAIEAWRRAYGPAVQRWLAAVGEAEALTSLATYAFEQPALPFPTIVDEGPLFDGEALAHPLLPAATRVPNDVALGGSSARPRLLLVSGSNMSGKSTLLRTVGVNVVLALAGAPVTARRLTLSPLAIGATLRVNDSLQEGRSRFYAEITRLRMVVDLTLGPLPVLFLLDEVLSGTNSHDRRIGAEAVIRTLLSRGALGFATTHDLALAEVAAALGPAAANVHFEDDLKDSTIAFDYRMRPGVIRKSNALALMRAVGLDVDDGSAPAKLPHGL